MLDPNWNHNGAINAIAGIVNERGNVLGMMPHPENHVESVARRRPTGAACSPGSSIIWRRRPDACPSAA